MAFDVTFGTPFNNGEAAMIVRTHLRPFIEFYRMLWLLQKPFFLPFNPIDIVFLHMHIRQIVAHLLNVNMLNYHII